MTSVHCLYSPVSFAAGDVDAETEKKRTTPEEFRPSSTATPPPAAKTPRLVEKKLLALESALGRQATVEEISAALGMDVEEYRFMLEEFYPLTLFTQRDFVPHAEGLIFHRERDHVTGADLNLADGFLVDVLVHGIEVLPEEERLIMSCRHQENLTIKETAAALSLPEGAARQLHSQAILRLRNVIARACAAIGARMQ